MKRNKFLSFRIYKYLAKFLGFATKEQAWHTIEMEII